LNTTLIYRSFAKINLYLEVIARRDDGYHNIETLFQTVGLSDTLRFSECNTGIELTCTLATLDCGPSNLVCQAAALIRERATHKRGVRIHLEKNIPIAAGLAGGSGNAAATLVALNRFWSVGLSDQNLAELALMLGSDVPYCLSGGCMVGAGRGEKLIAVDPLPHTWFILVHPAIGISAGRVYNSARLRFAQPDHAARFGNALGAMQAGQFRGNVFNRLETPVFAEYPELASLKKRLVGEGCVDALMSGSGSTMFGICTSESHARGIAARLGEYRTSVACTVPHGVEQIHEEI
jgi:4-diphosphocytidyl-2-C-methyl-D-erythritol kinase